MLSKNNSTRNILYRENGGINKSKYSLSTISTCSSTVKLNESFELDTYSKGKTNFDDNVLDKCMNNIILVYGL